MAAATWLLVAVLFRMSSLAALVAAVAAPLLAMLPLPLMGLPASGPVLALSVATAILIWLRHHENIARILKGTEPRIGAKKG
jgi:glycerol-3-phosphate acyltransferase PlsY